MAGAVDPLDRAVGAVVPSQHTATVAHHAAVLLTTTRAAVVVRRSCYGPHLAEQRKHSRAQRRRQLSWKDNRLRHLVSPFLRSTSELYARGPTDSAWRLDVALSAPSEHSDLVDPSCQHLGKRAE